MDWFYQPRYTVCAASIIVTLIYNDFKICTKSDFWNLWKLSFLLTIDLELRLDLKRFEVLKIAILIYFKFYGNLYKTWFSVLFFYTIVFLLWLVFKQNIANKAIFHKLVKTRFTNVDSCFRGHDHFDFDFHPSRKIKGLQEICTKSDFWILEEQFRNYKEFYTKVFFELLKIINFYWLILIELRLGFKKHFKFYGNLYQTWFVALFFFLRWFSIMTIVFKQRITFFTNWWTQALPISIHSVFTAIIIVTLIYIDFKII